MTWRKRPCRLCGRKTHPEELTEGVCPWCLEDHRVKKSA